MYNSRGAKQTKWRAVDLATATALNETIAVDAATRAALDRYVAAHLGGGCSHDRLAAGRLRRRRARGPALLRLRVRPSQASLSPRKAPVLGSEYFADLSLAHVRDVV